MEALLLLLPAAAVLAVVLGRRRRTSTTRTSGVLDAAALPTVLVPARRSDPSGRPESGWLR